ncbi:poly(A)-binding protein binding protein [Basidiobolus ranarum]|uniref:Poly(A)-binding protein binding protein n=1 Tax=Basidiobolus ranarum TaxID=34480 RepID=A0ABR2W575_9FUNG
MSSVSGRQQKTRRQDFPFQPTSQRGGRGKWGQYSNTLPRGGGPKPWGSHQNSSPQSHIPTTSPMTHSVEVKNDSFAKHMHDRMLYLLMHLVGLNVQVVVKSGAKYEGLFHAACTEGELGVVLKYARVIKTEEKTENLNEVIPTLIILAKDFVEMNAVGVDFSISEKGSEKDTFKIDTLISGHTGSLRERELHRWNADDHTEFQTLEELEAGTDNQWDQFAANEHLFGLQTDFDEEIYTTKLDRSSADYKEREKQAIRIANEIARMSSANPHIAEERGQSIDDSQLDEEDKYSSVVRTSSLRSSDRQGKYTPPAMRTKVPANQSQGSDSAATIAQPNPSNVAIENEPKSKPKQSETASKDSTLDITKPSSTGSAKTSNSQTSKIAEPIASLLGSKSSKKTSNESNSSKPNEAEIVGTFRNFVNHEKERLQQTRQAYLKMEKDGRVAELIKFSQSFKLKTPMPADLIPILGKDKSKKSDTDSKSDEESVPEPQEDIPKSPKQVVVSKTADEKESKQKPPTVSEDKPSDKTDKKAAEPTSAGTTSTPAAKPSSTFKFNVKASEFKPNPTAAPFIPSSYQNSDKKSSTNAASSPFFGNKNLKRGHTSVKEMLKKPDMETEDPSTIAPTWPFGQKSFRHQFSHTATYEEDMYSHNGMNQAFVPYVAYRYPAQFPGMPAMGMQQPPMPYMTPAPFVPNMPFSASMPHPGGPPPAVYSPQMTPVSAPRMYPKGQAPPSEGQHFAPPGGYPPQGRGPMVPNMPPQMYTYPGPQGPMMVRYPSEMMPHVTGPPMMVPQRSVMDQPPMAPYTPNEQSNEGLTNDVTTNTTTS